MAHINANHLVNHEILVMEMKFMATRSTNEVEDVVGKLKASTLD
jgi:hypothetical protein